MEEKTVRRRELRVTPEKKKRKLLVPFLAGLGVAALVPVIGSTLAAQITLNGGGQIEFGQGRVTTTQCDAYITVTPHASYDSGSSSFLVDQVELSEIDGESCQGKIFTLTALTDGLSVNIGNFTYNDATDHGSHTFTVSVSLNSDNVRGFILESSSS